MRVGCPWRDLPVEFGCWNSIYQQFNRWSVKDKWLKIFKNLVQEPDLEWEFIFTGGEIHDSKVAPDLIAKLPSIMEAAQREKRFKNWCRQWKVNLIEESNPRWRDLYKEICS